MMLQEHRRAVRTAGFAEIGTAGSRRRWALLPMLLALCACAPLARYDAAGELAGQPVMTRVDSAAAVYYLESYLPGHAEDPDLDARLDAALAGGGPSPQDRLGLQALTRELSTDVASMYFVDRLYAQPDNRRMQDRYHAFLERLNTAPREDIVAELAAFSGYQIVFIPGYAYRSNPANGADFSRQRALLSELGFSPLLIETEELGTVERNAEIVTDALRELAVSHDKLVLVSASKGGAEAAIVLNALQSEPAGQRIQAWISVGGLLRGSPYADACRYRATCATRRRVVIA